MTNASKLTESQFIVKAITSLRNDEKSAGIHSVFSGFNSAFKNYFECESTAEAIEAVNEAVSAGLVETQFVRGGVMIYLAGEAPERADRSASVLAKMGIAPKGSNPAYSASRKASPITKRQSR